MKNILKGLLVGTGKIIPGVSGSLIAISLNIYDRLLFIIGNPLKIKKNDAKFLFQFLIGLVISIMFLSKFMYSLLNKYYIQTMFLFIGLILGGLPSIYKITKEEKNLKNILFLLFPITVLLFLSTIKFHFNIELNLFSIIIVGIIEALTTIIPGISGFAIFSSLGIYKKLLKIVSTFEFPLFLFFILGIIIGVIMFAKLIYYVLNKFKYESYYTIFGLSISTSLIILKETLSHPYNFSNISLGLVLLLIGYTITRKLWYN